MDETQSEQQSLPINCLGISKARSSADAPPPGLKIIACGGSGLLLFYLDQDLELSLDQDVYFVFG